MGYTTNFIGSFKFNRQLTLNEFNYLRKFSLTRRMKRNVDEKYGVEGEFYVGGEGYTDGGVVDSNQPPKTQPGLWCQWTPSEDGWYLQWNGGEKFYYYIEWLRYIIDSVLPHINEGEPLVLNGVVTWQGEDYEDRGSITVKNNVVTAQDSAVPEDTVECPNCDHEFSLSESKKE